MRPDLRWLGRKQEAREAYAQLNSTAETLGDSRNPLSDIDITGTGPGLRSRSILGAVIRESKLFPLKPSRRLGGRLVVTVAAAIEHERHQATADNQAEEDAEPHSHIAG